MIKISELDKILSDVRYRKIRTLEGRVKILSWIENLEVDEITDLVKKFDIANVVVPKGTCCLNPKKIGKVNDMFESWDECENCDKEIV